ncbi:hypothetical protein ONZ45_g11541 [Pleurotus djamor]|nr:hypothetical protein ONZ45_g11541 [Pleurotus djamor]
MIGTNRRPCKRKIQQVAYVEHPTPRRARTISPVRPSPPNSQVESHLDSSSTPSTTGGSMSAVPTTMPRLMRVSSNADISTPPLSPAALRLTRNRPSFLDVQRAANATSPLLAVEPSGRSRGRQLGRTRTMMDSMTRPASNVNADLSGTQLSSPQTHNAPQLHHNTFPAPRRLGRKETTMSLAQSTYNNNNDMPTSLSQPQASSSRLGDVQPSASQPNPSTSSLHRSEMQQIQPSLPMRRQKLGHAVVVNNNHRASTIPARSSRAITYHYAKFAAEADQDTDKEDGGVDAEADTDTEEDATPANPGTIQREDTILTDQIEESIERIKHMGVKVHDFAYIGGAPSLTQPNAAVMGPHRPQPTRFSLHYALAEYDLRTTMTKTHRPPIKGLSLSRLLQAGWISLEEIKERCIKGDWAELRKFRRTCLQRAGVYAMSEGLTVPDIDEDEERDEDVDLELSLGPTHGKQAEPSLRWSDGDSPWRVFWNGLTKKPAAPCLGHVFNSRAGADDSEAVALLSAFKPLQEERLSLVEVYRSEFQLWTVDRHWYDLHGR